MPKDKPSTPAQGKDNLSKKRVQPEKSGKQTNALAKRKKIKDDDNFIVHVDAPSRPLKSIDDVNQVLTKKKSKAQHKSESKNAAKARKTLNKQEVPLVTNRSAFDDNEVEMIDTSSKKYQTNKNEKSRKSKHPQNDDKVNTNSKKDAQLIEYASINVATTTSPPGKRSTAWKAQQNFQKILQEYNMMPIDPPEVGSDEENDGDKDQVIDQIFMEEGSEEINGNIEDGDKEYNPLDPNMKDQDVQSHNTDQKSSKAKRYEPTIEQKQYIESHCLNYTMKFGLLKLRETDIFANIPSDEYESVKGWYKRRYRGKVKQQEFKVPQVQYPNKVLMNLLNDSVGDDKVKAYIAWVLETHLPVQLQSQYSKLALEQILTEIEKCSDDAIQLVALINDTPLHLRLKATASAISMFEQKGQCTDDHRRSWFSHCIMPALSIQNRINHKEFEQAEIVLIKDICEFCNPFQFDEFQAVSYLTLLKQGNILDLDEARNNFIDKSEEFWFSVLVGICGLNKDMASIWIQHKEDMISQALYTHYQIYNMNKQFATSVSKFSRLSVEEISQLQQMQYKRRFQMLIGFLNDGIQHDFQEFKEQTKSYMDLDNQSQIQSCNILSNAPLREWDKYRNQIMASNAMISGDVALKTLQKAISTAFKQDDIVNIADAFRQSMQKLWEVAFGTLNEKILLQEFSWQKELVIILLHLLNKANRKNIIVTLCTGHGKSVIIQLLADILVELNGKIIIVCLNDFLAYQSDEMYGSLNVRKNKITYISIADFFKRKPDPNVHVIFDEIDSMLGAHSFNLVHQTIETKETDKVTKTDIVKAIYNVSLMKQWKSVIGFSGTIADSIQDQLTAELVNPVSIDIPSLRVNERSNKLVSVVKLTTPNSADLFNAIGNNIQARQALNDNFIVIFEDKHVLDNFCNTSAYIEAKIDRNSIIFKDFSANFAELISNLYEVANGKFLILTTKEGARGVDFKGVKPAYVIIAFRPESYSQCVQALGRGCRELTSFAEGSIICQNPTSLNPASYLNALKGADAQTSGVMKINCNLARNFHNYVTAKELTEEEVQELLENEEFVVNEKENQTMLMLEKLFKKGRNIKSIDNGDQLWDALRKMDNNEYIPEDFYQEWNQ